MKVMVVEDNRDIAHGYARWLKARGYEFVVMYTCEDALAEIEVGEHPQVVISDLDLGQGMTGLDFADVVAAKLPDAKFALLTGSAWAAKPARERGIPFFTKPTLIGEVLAALGC